MTLDRRTEQHLSRARRNHDIADALIAPDVQRIVNPPPLEWAVVVAFYAAVHYVNAYLWEKLRTEPGDHEQRAKMVSRLSDLRAVFGSYRRLQDLAFHARYARTFTISPSDAADAVQTDLRAVESAVLMPLNL